MEFSDLLFLYILLPVLILIYFLMPDMRKRNIVLLAGSLLLYAMGQPAYMGLLVLLSWLNYKLALKIDLDDRSTVILPVAINICLLVIFRYLDFFLDILGLGGDNGLFLGFHFAEPSTVVPVGIAFYTFSVISYLLDVYNNKIDPEENFQMLLLYFMVFPKLLQGPIVRYEQVADQLYDRRHHPRAAFEGMRRFLFGLAKKVLLADYCGRLLMDMNFVGADSTLAGVWFAAILFMFRIYYEFSGYADMSIGLGRIFGFRFCENYNRPYLALSVSEFWHRWNISLDGFFRDYVYLPLGGDRMGKPRQVFNMLVVCVLTGLWYGAQWNYVLWGLYFFVILTVEMYYLSSLDTMPDWVCRCITLWLLLVGWIIFSQESISELQVAFLATLGFGGMATPGLWTQMLNSVPMMIICFVGYTTFPKQVKQVFDGVCGMGRRPSKPNMITPLRIVHALVSLAVMCLLLWLCTVSLVGSVGLPSVFGNV